MSSVKVARSVIPFVFVAMLCFMVRTAAANLPLNTVAVPAEGSTLTVGSAIGASGKFSESYYVVVSWVYHDGSLVPPTDDVMLYTSRIQCAGDGSWEEHSLAVVRSTQERYNANGQLSGSYQLRVEYYRSDGSSLGTDFNSVLIQ